MVELLVVMFVITMLLGIGVPAVIHYRTQSKINSCRVTINAVDKAISMYHDLHKEYPDLKVMPSQLIGLSYEKNAQGVLDEYDDGKRGVGYRLQARGTVYGPWNGVDRFRRTGDWHRGGSDNRVHFKDAFDQPIWYCPFDPDAATDALRYKDADFTNDDTEGDDIVLQNIADYAKDRTGKFYRRDYILMSQSANGQWGKFSYTGTRTPPTDDVTNFIRE